MSYSHKLLRTCHRIYASLFFILNVVYGENKTKQLHSFGFC